MHSKIVLHHLFIAAIFLVSASIVSAATPAQLAPANGVNDVSVNVLLDWANLAGASGYDYQVYQGSTLTAANANGPISSSYIRLNLSYATTYKWRVRGRVLPQDNPWSGYWTFTTEPVPMPGQIAPAAGATIGGRTVNLSWTAVDEADGYDYELWDGSTMIAGYGITYSGGPYRNTSVQFTLTYGKTYTWRVRARVLPQNNPWTGYRAFTTPAPPMPTITAPADGSILLSDTVTLSWTSVPEADGYDFEVTDGGAVVAGYGINYSGGPYRSTSVALTLPRGRTYQCRVRARVLPQDNPWTSPRSFTLQVSPPGAPVVLNIAPGSVMPRSFGQAIVQTHTGSTIEAHLYRLNDNVTLLSTSGANGNSIPLPTLSPGASYRLELRASNAGGISPVTTIYFSAAGLPAPSGLDFTTLDAYDVGELVANPVDGAESYEITLIGSATGTLVFQSANPGVVFDLDEDPGSTVIGTIVAKSAFSRSASATAQRPVKRPSNLDKAQWSQTRTAMLGSSLSFTVAKQPLENILVKKYNFSTHRFDSDSTFTVAVASNKRSVTVTCDNTEPSHSGLYRIVWKNKTGETAYSRFYFRVAVPESTQPTPFALEATASDDYFSGFQFVGLTKAKTAAFDQLVTWFGPLRTFSDFNLEIECLPITYYDPNENAKHPMDAVFQLIKRLYPGGGVLRSGKLRVEIDLFFAHRAQVKHTEYYFEPKPNATPHDLFNGISYKEFRLDAQGQATGGNHYEETLRRINIVADFFSALTDRADLVDKLDFVICIELEDQLGKSGISSGSTISDMTEAYRTIAQALAKRGFGLEKRTGDVISASGFPFPVHFRRVYAAGSNDGVSRSRIESMSKENHNEPVKDVSTDSKIHDYRFDQTKIRHLLDADEPDGQRPTGGDGYSNDGDGEVDGNFSNDQIRQIYGLSKSEGGNALYSGLVQEYINKGISLKPWRLGMNSQESDKNKSPRDRGGLQPFAGAEARLLKDFLRAVTTERNKLGKSSINRARSLAAVEDDASRFVLAGSTILEDTSIALPATVDVGRPKLSVSFTGDYLTAAFTSMPLFGAVLEGSFDLETWEPIAFLPPGTSEVSLSCPATAKGFLRLITERTLPAAPLSLTASLDEGAVSVGWNTNSATQSRFFIVERRSAGQDWTSIETLYSWDTDDSGRINILDPNAPAGVWVEYRVHACNSGGASAPCEPVSVWIPPRPSVVSNVTITLGGASGRAPIVAWAADPVGIATEFIVERAFEDTDFVSIAAVPPGESLMDDEEIAPGTYRYRVFAKNGSGYGLQSQEIQIIVP